MRRLFSARKISFADAIASRFAFWIINRKGPPDRGEVEQLEAERKRHLQRLLIEVALYCSLGIVGAGLLPEWGLVIAALVLLLIMPRIWQFGRDSVSSRVLFRPAGEVAGLLAEVEKARGRSPRVAEYYDQVQALGRPIMRIEALAMVTVPQLKERDWLDPTAPGADS